jgi:hypothetical protein
LAVLTLAVLWLGIMSPVIGFYDTRADRLDELRARVARETALIAALPQLRAEAAAAAKAPQRAVLAGNSDAIAGATLQEQVQSMASGVVAQLTSIETLPAEQVGAYRRIGVHVELAAQLSVVIQLLRATEHADRRYPPDRNTGGAAKRPAAARRRLHRLCLPGRHRQGGPAMTGTMRSRLWGGASAVLLLILIVEWAWPIPSLAPGPPAPLPSLAARAVLPARQTAGWVSLILARPLFTINRRPAKSAAGPAAAAAGDARLCGIMISATLRRAIFAPEGGGKPLVLGEGASVNDSVIARILPDRVIMASGTVLLPL